MKLPNFAFYGVCKQAMMKFFSLSELGYGPQEFNSRSVRLKLTKKMGRNNY